MSYEIIYQYNVHRVAESQVKDGMPRYVLSIEAGSNNCYAGNKRARSWQVMAVGTQDEVLRQTVRLASSCEGGMLKPGGKDCTPEALIGKVRRLLKEADKGGAESGWWAPAVRTTSEEVTARARELGASIVEEQFYGQTMTSALFQDNLDGYFQFVSESHRTMYGHQLGKVYALRAS